MLTVPSLLVKKITYEVTNHFCERKTQSVDKSLRQKSKQDEKELRQVLLHEIKLGNSASERTYVIKAKRCSDSNMNFIYII